MTKRDWFGKWTVYMLALLLLFVAQTMLLNRFTVFGVYPLLLPIAVAAVGSFEGSAAGAGFGIAAGLLCDAAFYNTDGFYTAVFMLTGLLSGVVAEYVLNPGFLSCALCSLGALAGIDLVRGLYYIMAKDAPVRAVLAVAGPEILYSLFWLVPVYLLVRSVYRRVGGTRLA
ncbi:hypothetical protein [Papillibacter cinnamivorans]|uniref:Rod shape-determining protein MreD n=1 Tax=Papillibacter cinnamivorans DSM 12816 TaxID=1122930 RepID=A0A1W2A8T0_9FIRM|nr:hypothetical protein [Papillibacter cinnamivorans]SMC56831.1 rod shape-determining protein MreD [Papillibacter cinnamivorans DSM 12816]